jgi:chromosome segregation ATPase
LEARIQELEREIEAAKPPKFQLEDDDSFFPEEGDTLSSNELDVNQIESFTIGDENGLANSEVKTEDSASEVISVSQSNSTTSSRELDALKLKNRSLIEENNSLSYRVQSIERDRLDVEEKIARLQESNSEHLHQIASLQSDLAATESLKFQLKKYVRERF